MNPHAPFVPPQDAGNVTSTAITDVRLEKRVIGSGTSRKLPNRQKYSKIVGLWQTEIGQPNEVSHLWFYPDLNARTEARARLGEDESWREFQGRGRPYLRELNNVLLQPTNFSPLK